MGYSLGGGVAFQLALQHPELVNKLVLVSTPIRRNAFYPDILAQQGNVGAAAAEAMKQTPMYQMYSALAPRPEDWPRLLAKIGEAMKKDFDYTNEVARIEAPTLIVAGDADIFPPAHAVEVFGLLGGGKRDGGWDGGWDRAREREGGQALGDGNAAQRRQVSSARVMAGQWWHDRGVTEEGGA